MARAISNADALGHAGAFDGATKEDRRRRLVNQRLFPRYFVRCSCERGCVVCAFTGLVSLGHTRRS